MKRKKRLLSMLLAVALCIGAVPYTASTVHAAGISAEKMNLTVNESKVAFAGYEWWVIGDENKGIYPNSDSITLLAKNKTIYSNDFKTTQFGVKNSDYSGSVLQNKMEEIANSFPEKEQGLINLRTLQGGGTSKEPSVDGIAGATVADQKLWALSETERSAINEINVQKYNFAFWLRSPSGDRWAEMGNGSGTITGLVPFGEVTRNDVSIRPALSLNLSSVLFTSLAAEGGKSSATVGSNLVGAEAPNGIVKFTMKDTSQTLTVGSITGKGRTLQGTYSGATTGDNQYVSCILTDSEGAVKYYGKLADSSNAASGTFSIPLSGVANGNYTLQIFSEEANGDLYTDFCSEPVTMKLTLSDGSGTVSDFSGTIHEHVWSTEWSSDDTAHWHVCTVDDCPTTNNSDKDGYAEHAYNQENTDQSHLANAATCTVPATYYKSCVCGKNGTETFTVGNATGHDWGEAEWNWSEDGTTATAVFTCKNDSNHKESPKVAMTDKITPATCTENGNIAYTASVTFEGTTYTTSNTVSIAATGHSKEHYVAVAPTATKPGNIEYWYCSVCDTYFKDEALTIEITKEQTVLAPTGEAEPSKPEESTPDKPDSDIPQTGDTSNMMAWAAVMLMAGAGMAGTIVYSRKRKHSR